MPPREPNAVLSRYEPEDFKPLRNTCIGLPSLTIHTIPYGDAKSITLRLLPLLDFCVITTQEYRWNFILLLFPDERLGLCVDFRARHTRPLKGLRFAEHARYEAGDCVYKCRCRKLSAREYVGADRDLLGFEYLLHARIDSFVPAADKDNVPDRLRRTGRRFFADTGKFFSHLLCELFPIGRKENDFRLFLPTRLFHGTQNSVRFEYHARPPAVRSPIYPPVFITGKFLRVVI